MKGLWKFKGGIKLNGFKSQSNSGEIRQLDVPPYLIIPVRQHIGAPSEPIVKVGDKVLKGQVIARGNGFISAPVHASSSGTVKEIQIHAIAHPSAISELCIVIESDGQDKWIEIESQDNKLELTVAEIRTRIREAGIVGLGGAVFPSAAKLKPTRKIDTLIINGAECEPYITCDDVLMRHRSAEVIHGAWLVAKVVEAKKIIIGVEDNKPEALRALQSSIEKLTIDSAGTLPPISAIAIPTIFPAGGEKQLIKTITGKNVPAGGLPYEVGVVCINVATVAATYQAIHYGQPLISRIVTVTGNDVGLPGNYQVRFGTPIQYLLDKTNSKIDSQSSNSKVIQGGPMMGYTIANLKSPVTKSANCILVNSTETVGSKKVSLPCIRCGQCEQACPMHLLPQQLYWHSRAKAFDQVQKYHIADCIECGCCAVVCPSHLDLVHYFKFSKTAIKAKERDAVAADIARLRSESRTVRLERIERDRQEQKAKRKAERLNKRKKQDKPTSDKPEPQQAKVVIDSNATESVLAENQANRSKDNTVKAKARSTAGVA